MNYKFVGGMADGLECRFPVWDNAEIASILWFYYDMDNKLMAARSERYDSYRYWYAGTDANDIHHYISYELDYEEFCLTGQDALEEYGTPDA